MSVALWSVVFNARDASALARFWAGALGWRFAEEDGYTSATCEHGTLRRLEFVPGPDEKTTQNSMHFDLSSTSLDDQRDYVQRLVDLGARHIDVGQGPNAGHFVLADPEGNEFCVLDPGNGFVDHAGRLGSLTCDGSPAAGYFWSAALGWPLVWDQDGETAVRAPDGTGQFLTFGGPIPTEAARKRLHIDVAPPSRGDQDAEVRRLEALGARRIDIGQGDVPWVVMADPDGNPFCVLTPRD